EQEAEGWAALADLSLATGHYRAARSELRAGITSDQKKGNKFSEFKKRILLATLTVDEGAFTRLANTLAQSEEPDPELVLLLGVALARAHRLDHADNMLRVLGRLVQQNTVPTMQSFYYVLSAELALGRHTADLALQAALEAARYENSSFALET